MSNWSKDNRKKPVGSRCGAKRRNGLPCNNYCMPNGRCRLHGGKSLPWSPNQFKKGNKAALKHGLYSKSLLEDEIELLQHIPLGNIDDEIKLLKIFLRRFVLKEKKFLTKAKLENPYNDEIKNLTKRIKKLEMERQKIVNEMK